MGLAKDPLYVTRKSWSMVIQVLIGRNISIVSAVSNAILIVLMTNCGFQYDLN